MTHIIYFLQFWGCGYKPSSQIFFLVVDLIVAINAVAVNVDGVVDDVVVGTECLATTHSTLLAYINE